MKHSFYILTLIYFLLGEVHCQSIPTALSLNRKEDIRGGKVHKIIQVNTYFGKEKKIISKYIRTVNDDKQLVHEERYEDGVLKSKYNAKYDSVSHQIKYRIIENWINALGYNWEKAVYLYDSNNHNIGVEIFGSMDRLKSKTKIVVNNKGYPIALANFDSNGRLLGGYEQAVYLEEKEKWIYLIFTEDGREVQRDTLNFGSKKRYNDPRLEYNDHDDVIKYNKTDRGYKLNEIQYDQKGNVVLKKVYDVTISKTGDEKKVLRNIYETTFQYED